MFPAIFSVFATFLLLAKPCRAIISCPKTLFFEGVAVQSRDPDNTYQNLVLRADFASSNHHRLLIEKTALAPDLQIYEVKNRRYRHLDLPPEFSDWQSAIEIGNSHLAWLDHVTVENAASTYDQRRSDFDPGFVKILRELGPHFRADAISLIATDGDGELLGTMRFVHVPFDSPKSIFSVTESFGYESRKGHRAPAIHTGENASNLLVRPLAANSGPWLPPELAPGEEILQIRVDRERLCPTGEAGVLWEVTCVWVGKSNPGKVRDRVWFALWQRALRLLFSRGNSFNHHNQIVFSYGTETSEDVYRGVTPERLRHYYTPEGSVELGPNEEQPKIGPNSAFYPLIFPITAWETLHSRILRGQVPRFRDSTAVAFIDPSLDGFLITSATPFLNTLASDARTEDEVRIAVHGLISLFQLVVFHGENRSNSKEHIRTQSARAWVNAQPIMKEAKEGLLKLLTHHSQKTRQAAIQTLAARNEWGGAIVESEDDEVIAAISDRLADTSPEVRLAALEAARYFIPNVVNFLPRFGPTIEDADETIRRRATRVVAYLITEKKLPAPESLMHPFLRQMRSPNAEIAANAIWGLQPFASELNFLIPEILSEFERLPGIDPDFPEQPVFSSYVSPLDQKRFGLAVLYQRILAGAACAPDLLIRVARIAPARFRSFALQSLAELSDEKAVDAVFDALQRDDDDRLENRLKKTIY